MMEECLVGEIVGIVSCTEFQSSLSCGAKVTEINVGIGQCGKCGLKQKLSQCKRNAVAKVVIENMADERKVKKTVTMFSDVINTVCVVAGVDSIDVQLLNMPSKEFVIVNNNYCYLCERCYWS